MPGKGSHGERINFPVVQRIAHLTPIKELFWSAVINGVAAVPIMVIIMLMAGNRKVMGQFELTSKVLDAMGWIATAVTGVAAALMFITM